MNSRQPIFPMIGTDPAQPANKWIRDHGLTAEDVALMGLRLVGYDGSKQMIGLSVKEGIHIPYPEEDYRGRVRNLSDHGPKYLSSKGSGCPPPYWSPNVPNWDKIRKNPNIPLTIVEGEAEAYCSNKSIQRQGHSDVVLGIGGIDAITTLFERGIAWRNRLVRIAFDKDKGCKSRDYKTKVSLAMGRLAAMLKSHEATVKIIHVPGDINDKVGLGDYLTADGDWPSVRDAVTEPPDWCEPLAWLLENCVLVTGTNHTHVFNLEDGSRKSVKDFHDAHIEKTRPVPKDGGGVRIEQLSRVWLTHMARQTARGYSMNPMLPFGLSGRDINLWRPFPTFEGELVPAVTIEWQKFMEGLFGEHWHWVGAWVGHMMTRPQEKAHQGVLVVTKVRGIGKSLFSEIVGEVVGKAHSTELRPEEVFSKFNSRMEGRVWLAVHELTAMYNTHEGQFNNLITSEVLPIEFKTKDVIEVPDLRRWYLTSNSSNPMRLSKGQRRFLVVHPPRTHGDTYGEWGQWVGSVVAGYKVDEAALGTIHEWFLHALRSWEEENGRWKASAPAPQTDASDQLAEGSMTVNQILASAAVEFLEDNAVDDVPMVVAISKEQFQMMPKVYSDIMNELKASGGGVGKKTMKVDKRSADYYVLSTSSNYFEKNAKREMKYVGALDNAALLAAGVRLGQHLRQKQEELISHGQTPKF